MADKQNLEKDSVTVVGPGADEELPDGVLVESDEPAGDEYHYPEGDDEDSPGRQEAEEARGGHAQNEPEEPGSLTREQKRRRKRRENHERLERENRFLASRNEQLEREHSVRLATIESRQTQSDVLAIDGRISQAENDVRESETLLQQALEAKDTSAAVEALRVRDQLRDGLRQLQGAKHHTVRTAQERHSTASQPAAVDPQMVQRAREWQREHPWFDTQARDDDSAIAYAIERRLFGEGRLHPASDEYWEEVDRRLARRLPEHYNNRGKVDDEDDDPSERRPVRRVNGHGTPAEQPRRASGPTIKVGGRERTLRKGEVYIDEDRKAAMIEAGVWEDLDAREKFLKSYQKYDREAGRRPR